MNASEDGDEPMGEEPALGGSILGRGAWPVTGQLALDFTLPDGPATLEQRAVVFTSASGELAYTPSRPGMDEAGYIEALEHFARQRGETAGARVMVRTVTVGEWRAAC